MIYYWKFDSDRVDILVENTDRATQLPAPDTIDITFFGVDEDPLHTVLTKFLIPTTEPGV